MSDQLTLDIKHPSPSQRKVLAVLEAADGEWVSGAELNRHLFAYSQRIGELLELGYPIERQRNGGDGLGAYRLVTR